MDRLIDQAVERANRQATEGPAELRQGRYVPERAAQFEAERARKSEG